MSTFILTREKDEKIRNFQVKCDLFSKQCAVLLGFVIPISTAATHIVLFFLMVTWFLAGNLEEKVKIIWAHPISRAFLLLFGVFMVGVLYSVAPSQDRIDTLGKMGKLLYLPFLLPMMTEEKWRRLVIFAFIGALILTLSLSILKTYADISLFHNRFTLTSVFKDPIYTNLMMAFASFVVGHYILQPSRLLVRAALFCLWISFIFYIFFMSVGRSGQVVFIMLWLLFCLQRLSLKGVGVGFVVLILLLGCVFTTSKTFQVRALSAIQDVEKYQVGETNTSLGARLEFFNQTWQLAKQRPWFGFGTGSFKQVYQTHATAHHLLTTRNPHNEYLNVFLQLGAFGLAVFLGFFVWIFKKSQSLPKPEQWFAQGVLIAMITGCFANSWLMDFTSGYFFVTLTAVCFGAFSVNNQDPS